MTFKKITALLMTALLLTACSDTIENVEVTESGTVETAVITEVQTTTVTEETTTASEKETAAEQETDKIYGAWYCENKTLYIIDESGLCGWYRNHNYLDDNYYAGDRVEILNGWEAFDKLGITAEESAMGDFYSEPEKIYSVKLYFNYLISNGVVKNDRVSEDYYKWYMMKLVDDDNLVCIDLEEFAQFELTRVDMPELPPRVYQSKELVIDKDNLNDIAKNVSTQAQHYLTGCSISGFEIAEQGVVTEKDIPENYDDIEVFEDDASHSNIAGYVKRTTDLNYGDFSFEIHYKDNYTVEYVKVSINGEYGECYGLFA